MKTISAQGRPHFMNSICWCNPTELECECCGVTLHRNVDVLPDERPRMAIFSDQRIWMPV